MKTKEEKKVVEKLPTAMESLRTQAKAMQVGPQYHLRKNWEKYKPNILKGGIGNR